ncbi:hypothetical protein ACB092_11G212300 [Castanea dentata]
MAGLGSHHAESQGSQPEDRFERLERRRDREGSVHTEYPRASHTHGGGSTTHEDGAKAMQKEINHLKRKLRRARRKPSPSSSNPSSVEVRGGSYSSRSCSLPSAMSSCEEDDPPARRHKKLPSRGLGNNAMSRALHQLSKSPFSQRIEKGRLPRRFTQPTFTIYNGRTDPVEHVSHFNQRMVVHSHNETLMCKVFPSSLGPVAMRWFNGLKSGSVGSFGELTRAFASRFVTCSKEPRPLDSLLSMAMREGETLKAYSVGLPTDHDLRKSLTKKPVRSVRRLMDRIDEYKRVEEYQQQGKGKEKVIPQERRDFRLDRYHNRQPRRDYIGQSGLAAPQTMNIGSQSGSNNQKNNPSWPALGTINVIFVAPGRTGSGPTRVMAVSHSQAEEAGYRPKRLKVNLPVLGFSEEDKVGTIQPHDNALVVTLRIGNYDVKRVMIDQGSGADIMYPNLFKGLRLKLEDLTPYDSPLISFKGKVVVPKGQIRLPVQSGSETVEVDFIVVDAYSPYTAILARPWLHTLGVVSSTLHVKVKFPSREYVEEILGSQSVAKQCISAAVLHQTEAESSALLIKDS